MKTKLLASILWLSLIAMATSTTFAAPRSDVLGLRLEMSKDAVRQHLAKVARLEKEDRRDRYEVWILGGDPQFASLLVGYDREGKVRYITAKAREGVAHRMRYREVAPLKDAQSESVKGVYHRYTWEFKASAKRAGYFLIAEGRDPEYLNSFSIKRRY